MRVSHNHKLGVWARGTACLAVALLLSTAAPQKVYADASHVKLYDASAVKAFYDARANQPFWTADPQLKEAQAADAILQNAWTQGMNPAQYHADEIADLIKQNNPANASQLEILLSDGVARYGHDMSGMRVDAGPIGQDPKYWRKPVKPADVLSFVAQSSDPAEAMRGMAPQDKLYSHLHDELIRLANEDKRYGDLLPLKFKTAKMMPGAHDPAIKNLRRRLDVVGTDEKEADRYDTTLVKAVEIFQKESGVKPDGIVGGKTLALLNQPPRDRMEQIVANMERIRWLDRDKPSRYVLVNIPQQMLWAIDDGKVAAQMTVVVGQKERQTKSFKTMVTGVRFNPRWTVPPSIKVKDMLPALQQDPTMLTRRHISLYAVSNGHRIDVNPEDVDWANITTADLAQMHMVQDPGDNNALGRIRVLMPNDYDIYMHDTNHRNLFAKTERLLSSGCVRLSDPLKMARFVLVDKKGWTEADTQHWLATTNEHDVAIDQQFPVYILYLTAWLSDNGHLVFGQDVYGQNRVLLNAMSAAHQFYLPGDDATKVAQAQAQGPGATVAAK